MQNGGSERTTTNSMSGEISGRDVEKQPRVEVIVGFSENATVVQSVTQSEQELVGRAVEVVVVADPQLSRNSSSPRDLCRVCQEEKEEALINLGCQCRGGLANAHHSCMVKWFNTRGSNICEICQQVAANVALPDSQTSYWVWRVDPPFTGTGLAQERERGCFSPLWVAFSILIAGLLLDVLVSITLGVSALPVNIIIGVIVVLGLATALRLGLEFCQEWNVRRVVQRVEANDNLGYHPTLVNALHITYIY